MASPAFMPLSNPQPDSSRNWRYRASVGGALLLLAALAAAVGYAAREHLGLATPDTIHRGSGIIVETSDLFFKCSGRKMWNEVEQDWCCKRRNMCDQRYTLPGSKANKTKVQVHKQQEGDKVRTRFRRFNAPAYTCNPKELPSATSAERSWCCKHGKPCLIIDPPAPSYKCDPKELRSATSAERSWCCKHGKPCLVIDPPAPKYKCDPKELPSATSAERSWCCKHGKPCLVIDPPAPPYKCDPKELPSATSAEKSWCCKHEKPCIMN